MDDQVVDEAAHAAGVLFVVSTPIGNLGDLSARAIETLREVDAILAEDTRHTRTLLAHFDIHTPLEAHHEHNEASTVPSLVARLELGGQLALVSDAGTPVLSDPGARLVQAAVAAGVRVVPIPGPSALLAALVGSGLPADRFSYFGFAPRKGPERRELLHEIAALRQTAVLYEAPSRLSDTLADLVAAGAGDRPAVVARELTKQFEEFRRGTVRELAEYYAEKAPRGEVVLVVQGGTAPVPDEAELRARASALRGDGLSARDAMRVLMQELGAPRNLAYRLAHEKD